MEHRRLVFVALVFVAVLVLPVVAVLVLVLVVVDLAVEDKAPLPSGKLSMSDLQGTSSLEVLQKLIRVKGDS